MAHARIVGSIPVENVQALAGKCNSSDKIPERYVRPELEAEEIVYGDQSNTELPIIDLSKLLDSEYAEAESAKLSLACQEWGFFQLKNHGVPDEVISKMKTDIIEFFNQPLEQKKAYAQLPSGVEGYGQAFVVSEDQKLDWADMFYLIVRPIDSRDLRFWPTFPASFRESLEMYSLETKKIAGCLLEIMARDLKVGKDVLFDVFADQPQGMRMNYYPPCPQADKVIGLSPHSDVAGLTLLLEVNNVSGLQIKKDGKWLPVKALPNTFIVNIGDILEVLSNGKYKSIEHRAVINTEKERISVAVFHGPHQQSTVGPLPDLVKGCEARYRSMGYRDYMKSYYSAKLDGRSQLQSIKL